jgi:hypothetical protein
MAAKTDSMIAKAAALVMDLNENGAERERAEAWAHGPGRPGSG